MIDKIPLLLLLRRQIRRRRVVIAHNDHLPSRGQPQLQPHAESALELLEFRQISDRLEERGGGEDLPALGELDPADPDLLACSRGARTVRPLRQYCACMCVHDKVYTYMCVMYVFMKSSCIHNRMYVLHTCWHNVNTQTETDLK